LNQTQTPAQPLPASSAPSSFGGVTATTPGIPNPVLQPQRISSTGQMSAHAQAMPTGQQTAIGNMILNTSVPQVTTTMAPSVLPVVAHETSAQSGLANTENNPRTNLNGIAPSAQPAALLSSTSPALGNAGPVAASPSQAAPAGASASVQAPLADQTTAVGQGGTS
jgi:hypothetical protein